MMLQYALFSNFTETYLEVDVADKRGLKTKPNQESVLHFLKSVPDEQKQKDAFALLELMRQATQEEGKMWGTSIVGFGSYHYKYASGREGDWFITGFSPRKQNLTLYIMDGFDQYEHLLQSLGKYKTGKSCLYIKRLSDVHISNLRELVILSVKHVRSTNL